MNKIKLSIIALSCAMALGACSSSSKGGSDNSEQIRQAEVELNQRIAEANKKADAAVKKAEAAIKTAKNNSEQTEAEKKAVEERLKQLENLQADEKARITLSDKVFGGISGEMKDTISGGTINLEKNELNSALTNDIRDLAIRDNDGKFVYISVVRRANIDPEGFDEEYRDPYHMVKEGQSILSNSDFQSSAFGTYFDNLTDNQYFYAQGNPTALAQIPTAGKVEYDGGAAYKKDGYDSQRTGMTATADFDNKVIDINIKEKPNFVPGMNFGGKITGNSFAGEVNGIKTQGGFFGENAQEMTGLFTNEADQSRGAFGGIKQ
ncbi:transferrin-binding protein-like solute binding protein [Haemophilus parainfluenzae]|uniref:transferrin-binding protein-like solute binding protein n=1 Tax=Haemophilus parainfluenzae TaxID=729 RepID=UPI0018758514|nr:transferrin-binding protein-like solute binding protein [Haemophilus parainfluenzae]MBE4952132.1 transferrin-binding protein-like solute binding protein [Haemophilus parainfluenzae]